MGVGISVSRPAYSIVIVKNRISFNVDPTMSDVIAADMLDFLQKTKGKRLLSTGKYNVKRQN